MPGHFAPDTRSAVGRQIVTDSFLAHRQRVFNVKPFVDTGAPKAVLSKAHAPPRRVPTVTEREHLVQVETLFNRLPKARSSVDTGLPSTFRRTKHLQGRHKRQEEVEMREHAYNIAHMQRRMLDAYSTTERRKNHYDPAVYPALLMRRSVDVFSLPLTAGMPQASSSPRAATQRTAPEHVQAERPAHAHSARAKPVVTAMPPRSPGRAATAADYVMFKQHLIDTIVSNRLYKPADLNQFFAAADAMHPTLDKKMKQTVISEIRTELQVFEDSPATPAFTPTPSKTRLDDSAPVAAATRSPTTKKFDSPVPSASPATTTKATIAAAVAPAKKAEEPKPAAPAPVSTVASAPVVTTTSTPAVTSTVTPATPAAATPAKKLDDELALDDYEDDDFADDLGD